MTEHTTLFTSLLNFVFPNDLHIHWSLMIVLYPYITGIVAGAFIVSSLYHVFGVSSLRPIARFSLLFALAFLACATWPLQLHLGHPERSLNMMITPSPTSAMAGFGYIYSLYGMVLLFEVLFIYRPTLVAMAGKTRGALRVLYTVLTFGSDNVSRRALALDSKIIHFLAAIGIPMACVLHGYVGFIFGGIKANPTWSTPLMPVIFLLSACVSGIAGLVVVYMVIMLVRKRPVDVECIRTCTKFLWGVFILDFTFEMLEVFSHSYLQTHHWEQIHGLLWGPLYNTYWLGQVMTFSVIPFLLLGWICLFSVRDKIVMIVAPISSMMLLIQVFLMRWNVVIGGQLMSKSGRGYTVFHPEWLDREGIIPAILVLIAPLFILYLLGKIFPFWQKDDAETIG